MERVLEKLAAKLNELDEASLMALWDKYQQQVKIFEPTKRWEIATLAWALIQSVHWKNQLFNVKLAQLQRPEPAGSSPVKLEESQELVGPMDRPGSKEGAKVIRFKPRNDG